MAANFASTKYASAFSELPTPDTESFRRETLHYLEKFDEKLWKEEPIYSILNGEKLGASSFSDTVDAFGNKNGHQCFATKQQVEQLKQHIRSYRSPYSDVRDPLRRIEKSLLTTHAGFLIGNQCVDFGKQDGVTEMEEATMANAVERNLNDLLLEDELSGKICIGRKPIYVSCVSNFTNFLDLFRKTIRCLELGIPCIILGRSNTVQHSYRWTELLSQLLFEEGVDQGMLTYLSCTLEDIKDITYSCQESTGNLYSTCSRALASSIMSSYPNTVASTGGPNTLVTTEWTPDVQDAIRMSATIESAGQCTALRHCVIPTTVTEGEVGKLFHGVSPIADARKALEKGVFDGVFAGHKGNPSPPSAAYKKNPDADSYFKISSELPEDGIEEYWRKVSVDFTQTTVNLDQLAQWLNRNQPISLAVNGSREKAFELGLSLFEKTGLVVNTIGSTDSESTPPAMTCQARPQEAEVFGEFPPRMTLGKYTRFPVVVPSSTPSYDAVYNPDYLGDQSKKISDMPGSVQRILRDVSSSAVIGYCIELLEYLRDATKENPKQGFGSSRTALWGLQRPPFMENLRTSIRCTSQTVFDDIAAVYFLFFTTNARSQVELSVDSSNSTLLRFCKNHQLVARIETDAEHADRVAKNPENFYNVINGDKPMSAFPMVGHFVSLYFPLGHIKSTMSNDEEFVQKFRTAEKWLKLMV